MVRFAANYGMMHLSELSRVSYGFIPVRDLLDTDIGWGPNILALKDVDNYGLGEVIQGPKPKKCKKVLLEVSEYDALIKSAQRVDFLEKMLASQVEKMESKEDAYTGKADPVFAIKASTASQGIKIMEGNPAGMKCSSQNVIHSCPPGDKGKKKMYAEDESGLSLEAPVGSNGICYLPNIADGSCSGNGPPQDGSLAVLEMNPLTARSSQVNVKGDIP